MNVVLIVISAVLVNNVILSQLLVDSAHLEKAKKTESAIKTGFAVLVMMTLTSAVTYLVNQWLLVPLNAEFLSVVAFILVIAGLSQLLSILLKRFLPKINSTIGDYMLLASVNSAILGMALINVTDALVANFFAALLSGLAWGGGFMLTVILLAGLSEKTATANIPKPFRGVPILLLTACLMAMAFHVFGMIQF